ncbi:MAG: HDOD domain-containing protein [Burkholderiaceae bacterium]
MPDFSPLSTVRKLVGGKPQEPEATLGRFELRRILGRGAQSVVWLAFDPRLEREVAIKLMKLDQQAAAATIPQWLQEARSVSRLTHPNIVPVFEADLHEQQPYLVFEYVPGQTLAGLLAGRGALPAAEAVALLMEILDALLVAHAAGVVHRDLKPSNVLVDELGRARVMDFGIAARIQPNANAGSGAAYVGTPGYMSPEALSGANAAPAMDVFSAGLVLAEMLSGKPLIAERDSYRAAYRVLHEQLALPSEIGGEVDDWLRAIVARALAREPSQRFASAQAFRDELARWTGASAAKDATPVEGGVGNGSGTLDFLLRRMRHKSDFPAMSHSVLRIQGMASSEHESIDSVTNEILKDVGLTNKLLRLVNSAYYARGGSIGTVSRAVSLVGFNGIRNMALSLVLLEHMQDKAHAHVLKEEFLRSLMAASIAAEWALATREGEEAFIGAMFQNLGRLLAEYYFPEEARVVRGMLTASRQPLSESKASADVLGIDFQALGLGVAKAWALPDSIQRCMRKPIGDVPERMPADPDERMRWLAMAANEMADALLRTEARVLPARLQRVATQHAKALGMSADAMLQATVIARRKLIELASAMDIKALTGSASERLLKEPAAAAGVQPMSDASAELLAPLELQATQPLPTRLHSEAVGHSAVLSETLAAGIQDITNAMVEDFKLSDVLRMILETMYRALDLQRIVFCMRDAKTDTLTGRFGLGRDMDVAVKAFNVKADAAATDLFGVVCARGADTMISDATEPRIAERLPDWYRKTIDAPTFLLLPLVVKGKPFGLIYADKAQKSALALDAKELALLHTLRNQAVMAFRTAR